MDENYVLNMLQLCGPLTHQDLMKKFDCGFYAIDGILRKLCKEHKVTHQILYTRKGYKNQHLFWVRKCSTKK